MTAELLQEIEAAIGERMFRFDSAASHPMLETALARRHCGCVVFLVRGVQHGVELLGFPALFEAFALYDKGAFRIISEFYVRPAHRGQGVGRALLAAARDHGRQQGWNLLEVTTPPLPAFSRTLGFHEREGFAVSGGRKLCFFL